MPVRKTAKKSATRVAKTARRSPRSRRRVMWTNHFALLPGDSSVVTTFNAVNSGVGTGLSGLVITSTTTGDIANGGGIKVVHMAVQVPPGHIIKGVRVCYELTSSRSFISQIRLDQLANPPVTSLIVLDDATDLTAVGPVCVNSSATTIHPAAGPVTISLRVQFGSTTDRIVVRGLGLILT